MEKLSVVIITKNEEKNIARCLASVAWADEIIVLDTGSTDATLALCEKQRCHIGHTGWLGFGPTKQKAVLMTSHAWVLSIDADEEVRPELRDNIRHVLALDASARNDAYRLPRLSRYINRWIRHSGWNNDAPVRLFDKNRAAFNNKIIHESVEVGGTIGTIGGFLYHYTYPTLQSHLDKIKSYSDLTAQKKTTEGKRGSVTAALLHGGMKFLKMYVLQAGFLDGKTGFVLAVNSAFGVYFKHLTHWEQSLQCRKPEADPSA